MTSNEALLQATKAASAEIDRLKAEHERQLAALAKEREALSGQRDNAMGELERMLGEAEGHREQAHFQKNLAEKTVENATRTAGERDALEQQLADLPILVVKIKLWHGVGQIHVGLPIGIHGSDISPIGTRFKF